MLVSVQKAIIVLYFYLSLPLSFFLSTSLFILPQEKARIKKQLMEAQRKMQDKKQQMEVRVRLVMRCDDVLLD